MPLFGGEYSTKIYLTFQHSAWEWWADR